MIKEVVLILLMLTIFYNSTSEKLKQNAGG